jgi:hypothetical protein
VAWPAPETSVQADSIGSERLYLTQATISDANQRRKRENWALR